MCNSVLVLITCCLLIGDHQFTPSCHVLASHLYILAGTWSTFCQAGGMFSVVLCCTPRIWSSLSTHQSCRSFSFKLEVTANLPGSWIKAVWTDVCYLLRVSWQFLSIHPLSFSPQLFPLFPSHPFSVLVTNGVLALMRSNAMNGRALICLYFSPTHLKTFSYLSLSLCGLVRQLRNVGRVSESDLTSAALLLSWLVC